MRTGLAAAALIICISTGYMACSRMRDRVDKAALITLGEAFSSISRAAQADHARLTLRQMEARAADAEKALMGKGKLYSTLGVLAGFAAALMMI